MAILKIDVDLLQQVTRLADTASSQYASGGGQKSTAESLYVATNLQFDELQSTVSLIRRDQARHNAGSAYVMGAREVGTAAVHLASIQDAVHVFLHAPEEGATMWVGGSGVQVGFGLPLVPGQTLDFPCRDLSTLYVVSGTAGQTLCYFGIRAEE